jgi:hypothetical protein
VNVDRRLQNADLGGGDRLQEDGFEIIPSFLRRADCENLIHLLRSPTGGDYPRSANRRNILLDVPGVLALARGRRIVELLASRNHTPFAVTRAILFDKTPEANWPVSWHQDQTIAVRERIDRAGFSAWSIKQGTHHVRPPREVLDRMITVRLHLDNCDAENGALQVLPGSHRNGLLSEREVQDSLDHVAAKGCEVPEGGMLLMKPLLLHASFCSTRPGHRRVLHIEYALDPLPGELKWFAEVPSATIR